MQVHHNASMTLGMERTVGPAAYSEVSGSSEKSLSSPEDSDSSPGIGEDNSDDSLLCNSPVHKTNKKNCSIIVYW